MNPWDDEDAADADFSRLFAALPPVQPSADFVQRTVDAAWEARTRRRAFRFAAAAAAVVVIAFGVLLATTGAPAWLVPTSARVVAGSVMAVLWSATAVAEFWTLMVRMGTAIAGLLVMPQSVALLVTIELVGAAALYSLHRLLRADIRFRNSGPMCI